MLNGAITPFTQVMTCDHFVAPYGYADSVPLPMSELSVRESVKPCATPWTVQPLVHGFRNTMWLSTTFGTDPGGMCTGCMRRSGALASAGEANAIRQTATPARRLI